MKRFDKVTKILLLGFALATGTVFASSEQERSFSHSRIDKFEKKTRKQLNRALEGALNAQDWECVSALIAAREAIGIVGFDNAKDGNLGQRVAKFERSVKALKREKKYRSHGQNHEQHAKDEKLGFAAIKKTLDKNPRVKKALKVGGVTLVGLITALCVIQAVLDAEFFGEDRTTPKDLVGGLGGFFDLMSALLRFDWQALKATPKRYTKDTIAFGGQKAN